MSVHESPFTDKLASSKQILTYMVGSLGSSLIMKSSSNTSMALEGFSNVDWATNLDD